MVAGPTGVEEAEDWAVLCETTTGTVALLALVLGAAVEDITLVETGTEEVTTTVEQPFEQLVLVRY